MDSMNSIIDIEALGHYYNAKDQACQTGDKMNANLRLDICSKLVISSGNVQLIKADAVVVPFFGSDDAVIVLHWGHTEGRRKSSA